MDWTDEGIIIGTRRHGETSLIVELMTPGHGRHLGLVGAAAPRTQRTGAAGGQFRACHLAGAPGRASRQSLRSSRRRFARQRWWRPRRGSTRAARRWPGSSGSLPERDPHPQIYDTLVAMVDILDDLVVAGGLIVRFELRMLEELGFGLDLERCAATGTNDDLAYVSPKSGRAVSRSAGDPYRSRMLGLPAFLPAPAGAARRGRTPRRVPPHRLLLRPPCLRAARAAPLEARSRSMALLAPPASAGLAAYRLRRGIAEFSSRGAPFP